jgi:hypothetical protein
MTEPILYSGARGGKLLALNTYERPAGTGTTAYSGIDLWSLKSYDLTFPEPRRIPHTGNDRLLATQQFPSIESITGIVAFGAEDPDIVALTSGVEVNSDNVAGAEMVAMGTDKQGYEPSVALILYQAAITKQKAQVYHFHLIYNTTMIPIPPGFAESPQDYRYSIAPNPVEDHIWGDALDETNDGATSAAVISGYTDYPPNIAAFVADGVETEFTFPATEQAVNATDISVFGAAAGSANLAEITTGITKATTGVTWDAAPAADYEIVIVYQMAI